jgi:hypothetical protein
VTVSNNGTEPVNSLSLNLDVSDISDDTDASDVEAAFEFTGNDGSDTVTVSNGDDLLSSSALDTELGSGNELNFGMLIDLLDSNISDLPDASYALTITAETANSN